MPGRIDDGGVGRVDPSGDFSDSRSLKQHVADGVIADALVHRQYCPALDQRAATLDADALGHRGRRRAMHGFKVDGAARRKSGSVACVAAKRRGTPAPSSDRPTSQI